jgi:aspartate-semialdehyde dehydrogenase
MSIPFLSSSSSSITPSPQPSSSIEISEMISKPSTTTKPSTNNKYTYTRTFVVLNVIAGCCFAITSGILLRYDFLNRRRDKLIRLAEGSIINTIIKDPRVGAYFLICLTCITWLVAFFSLGLVYEINHDVKKKKNKKNNNIGSCKTIMTISNITSSNNDNRIPVAILGGTGLVGRALALRLENHPTLKLGMLVGSPDSEGKPISNVWLRKETILKQHYGDWWLSLPLPSSLENKTVTSFKELMNVVKQQPTNNNNIMVISVIAPALGWMEDELINAGVNVFSISPHKRMNKEIPLIVPEVNIQEMFYRSNNNNNHGLLFKSPNCVSVGVCLVLDAIQKNYGELKQVSITTFQSLTGRGDALYPRDQVVGNILPLGNTEEDTNNKIRDEVSRVLGQENLPISVTAQRVFTQRGHYIDVRVKTSQPVLSVEEFAQKMESYSPFQGTIYEKLPDSPTYSNSSSSNSISTSTTTSATRRSGPIQVTMNVKEPRPIQSIIALNQCNDSNLPPPPPGMAIQIGHISTQDRVFDVCFSFVVDNVARGAYGAALLMAECYLANHQNNNNNTDGTNSKVNNGMV